MTSTGTPHQESAVNNPTVHHQAFQKIIDRFGVLLRRQQELRSKLTVMDISITSIDDDQFLTGQPIVAFLAAQDFEPLMQKAAQDIWPVLSIIFPPLAESLGALGQRLETDAPWTELCLQAVVHGDAAALDQAATQAIVAPEFLLLALRAAYAPCIAAQKDMLGTMVSIDLWRYAYCPVCGSDPDLGFLKTQPEPSEFLVSKSGEMWHHCSTCTQQWRFLRMQCPGCGNKDHETLRRYSLPDHGHQIVYACKKCQQYLLCINTIDRADKLNLDFAALDLVHLDALAQSKGYTPLSPAPWTIFDFQDQDS